MIRILSYNNKLLASLACKYKEQQILQQKIIIRKRKKQTVHKKKQLRRFSCHWFANHRKVDAHGYRYWSMLMNIARKNSKLRSYHHVPRLRIPQRKKDESLHMNLEVFREGSWRSLAGACATQETQTKKKQPYLSQEQSSFSTEIRCQLCGMRIPETKHRQPTLRRNEAVDDDEVIRYGE